MEPPLLVVDELGLTPDVASLSTRVHVDNVASQKVLEAPDDNPSRHVYVCERDGLALRNHLAVRDVLRCEPALRERYGALKMRLAKDPDITMGQYVTAKSAVLQEVLRTAGMGGADRAAIRTLNGARDDPPDEPWRRGT